MRKLILKMEVTIDGFVGEAGGDPAWPVAYYDDELAAHEADLLSRAGVHAMGRQAYEDMNPHWQASTGPIADAMNAIPKAVFSSTLQDANWPETTIYRGELKPRSNASKHKTAARSSPTAVPASRRGSRASSSSTSTGSTSTRSRSETASRCSAAPWT